MTGFDELQECAFDCLRGHGFKMTRNEEARKKARGSNLHRGSTAALGGDTKRFDAPPDSEAASGRVD